MTQITTDKIYALLSTVKDPEIPVISLVDLGVITSVSVHGDAVKIEMTPTFVGCPALDMMQREVREVLFNNGIKKAEIEVTYRKPWTSDLISEEGKESLKKFGLAPPPPRSLVGDLDILNHVECPRCGKRNTEMRNVFGPTLCRSIHYCNDCREAFEQFKPL